MSRIFKKLNVDVDQTSAKAAPNLHLVPEVAESPRPKSHPKKAQNQNRAAFFKRSTRQLKMLAVLGAIGLAIFYTGKKVYPIYAELTNPTKPTTPPLIESVSLKAKMAGDEVVHQEASEFFKAKDYAKALEKFEVLLKKYPIDASLLNNVGLVYLKLGEFQKAEEHFQKVLKIDPKDAVTYNNLGTLKMAQMNSEEAISYFYQAILYHPEMLEPHLNLAKAFELAGRPMEAIPEYQHYLDHSVVGGDQGFRKLIEKRIVKLNSFSRYIEQGE